MKRRITFPFNSSMTNLGIFLNPDFRNRIGKVNPFFFSWHSLLLGGSYNPQSASQHYQTQPPPNSGWENRGISPGAEMNSR